jgi:hypothetical protein
MKKINWYKFTIVAFSIWLVNKIASIRLGSFTPHFIAIVLFIIIVLVSSCASYASKLATAKAPARATKLLDKKYQASRSQYAFVNNQIIIFENN